MTSAAQAQAAADTVGALDVLVNNAGIALYDDLNDRAVLERHLTGPTDTDMSRGFDAPKASPESVARAIFDGVEDGVEDILPDTMSATMAESWRSSAAKALERQYAAIVDQTAASA